MALPTAQGSPISLILQSRQQGLSNNQIIQNLQRQGYSNTQILDAMNQADIKNVVENVPPQMLGNDYPNDPGEFISEPIQEPAPVIVSNQEQPVSYSSEDSTKTEELIEAIIDEKWSDLIKNVGKIVEWKNRAEARISAVEMKIDSIKENFEQLHKAVVGKVSEYDKHILDVGTEIKAMEKVFAKVLPAFTENVHELSRITERMKPSDE